MNCKDRPKHFACTLALPTPFNYVVTGYMQGFSDFGYTSIGSEKSMF